VLLVAACGRTGFSPVGDAASTDAGDADAAPCELGPFGSPSPLPGPTNSSDDDWTPSISRDDLTLVFYSLRASTPGSPDLWRSTRATPDDDFDAASEIVEASSPGWEASPQLVAGGLDLFFISDRPGSQLLDIYLATRTSTASPFGTPVRIDELSSEFDEDSLWVSHDGLRVMLSSNRGASIDLYQASRPDRSSPFSAPTIVSELSTLAEEGSPALSDDELEVLFISNRSGGAGAYDVWRAERATTTSPFSIPTNVTPLNSADDEWGLTLSRDGHRVYYSYDATLAGGNADIWVATRACR
jgi:Tol biopolymer transport system component